MSFKPDNNMDTIYTTSRFTSPRASCLALFATTTMAVAVLGTLYFHHNQADVDNWLLAIGPMVWLITNVGMVIAVAIAELKSHIVAMSVGVISGAGLLALILSCISP